MPTLRWREDDVGEGALAQRAAEEHEVRAEDDALGIVVVHVVVNFRHHLSAKRHKLFADKGKITKPSRPVMRP